MKLFNQVSSSVSRAQIQQNIGRCFNTTHYILIGFCAIILIFGLAMFSVGVSSQADENAAKQLRVPGIQTLPIWMIVLGIFLTALAIVGGVGAFMYNRPMLAVFVVILGLLTLFEFGVGIAAAVEFKNLPGLISKAWDLSSNVTRCNLQNQYKCCGYWGPTDRVVPICIDTTGKATYCNGNVTGCHSVIERSLKGIASAVGGAGLAISLLELGGVIITVALLFRIRSVFKKEKHQRLPEESIEQPKETEAHSDT